MPEVTIRYFAAARTAAGESSATADAASIRDLIGTVSADRPELARVLGICTFLLDGRARGPRHPPPRGRPGRRPPAVRRRLTGVLNAPVQRRNLSKTNVSATAVSRAAFLEPIPRRNAVPKTATVSGTSITSSVMPAA